MSIMLVNIFRYTRSLSSRLKSSKHSVIASRMFTANQDFDDHQKGPDYVIPTTVRRTWHRNGAVSLLDFPPYNGHVPISIPTSLKLQAEKNPDKIAFAIQREGEWFKWTFSEYYEQVRLVAKAFIKLGLKRFHAVGILGANGPEWVISEMAAIFAGGLAMGMYQTNSPSACSYLLRDSGANICLFDTDIQLKKILEIRNDIPELTACIQWTGTNSQPGIILWNDLLELGKTVSDEVLEKRLRGISVNQPCVIVYTSGTTGAYPKGCLCNHDQIIYSSRRVAENYDCNYDDVNISHLPMSHMLSQIGDIFMTAVSGLTVYFAKPDALKGSLAETLKEVRPTVMASVPRVWEKVMEKLSQAEAQMPWLQRHLFAFAKKVALRRYTENNLKGDSALFLAARKLFFKKIHTVLGLDRTRALAIGATLVEMKLLHFLYSIDLPMYEMYGLTESIGVATANHPDHFRIGSVGKPFEASELKISEDGEICLTGRCVMMGYLNNEKETKETIDDDHWLHSGDLGRLDEDGFLYITGRKKELLITSGGENVAPLPIEDNIRRELPIVSNAMVIADKRKYLSVLLTFKTVEDDGVPTDILTKEVQDWFQEYGCRVLTVQEAIENLPGPVHQQIQAAIGRVNVNAISNAARVQKWKFLEQDFSIATGEIGPTMKLRRPIIVQKYSKLIDSLYNNS